MNNIYVGKITGCHGIKGELKVLSDFEYSDKVFTKGVTIIIDNAQYKISSMRIHKNFYLITINELYDINKVDHLINQDIYITKEELNLKEDEYLLEELIGAKVQDNNETIGIVTDVLLGNINNFVKVDNSFLIPLTEVYIDHFDKNNNILYTKNGKSLKLD